MSADRRRSPDGRSVAHRPLGGIGENNLVLLRKNPRRSHPQPTDTRSAGANRSPLHPTKLPPRPRTAISGCVAIGFGMGKGREGGVGPTMGRSILSSGPARACWRHSRGIQRRPAGGDHWSRAHVRGHLLKFTSKGLFRRVFQHEEIFISLRATHKHMDFHWLWYT